MSDDYQTRPAMKWRPETLEIGALQHLYSSLLW